MSNASRIILAVVAVLLLAANLLPLRRGQYLTCPGVSSATPRRAVVHGLPLGFYTTTGQAAAESCTLSSGANLEFGARSYGSLFTAASLWFDLTISGGIVLGTYFVFGRRRAE